MMCEVAASERYDCENVALSTPKGPYELQNSYRIIVIYSVTGGKEISIMTNLHIISPSHAIYSENDLWL